jgi:UDP-N-acetylmuramyl pentapeptide phosphotransferase/UDP-N-acetylglucosamine-1-phosphate transferase
MTDPAYYIYFINVTVLIGSYVIVKKLLPYIIDLITSGGLVKENWRKESIPTAGGIIFPAVLSITMLPYLWWANSSYNNGSIYYDSRYFPLVNIFALQGAALLGLVDDVLGSTRQKGLKGHFKFLLLKKRLSTGVIKAAGTGILATWIVAFINGKSSEIILNWLLLLLTVNFINLLDLRPGRAIKGTVVFLIIPAILKIPGIGLLFAVLGSVIAYAPYDLKGKVMLGDTGANALGMAAGLVLIEIPLSIKGTVVLLLVLIHLVTEKYSISSFIERSPILSKIDQWGQEKV